MTQINEGAFIFGWIFSNAIMFTLGYSLGRIVRAVKNYLINRTPILDPKHGGIAKNKPKCGGILNLIKEEKFTTDIYLKCDECNREVIYPLITWFQMGKKCPYDQLEENQR